VRTANKQPAPASANFAGAAPEKWEVVPCAFCRARGTDPFNLLSEHSRCESCHGRGTVLVARPHARCTLCSGSGGDKTFRCPACRGAGVVGVLLGPTAVCRECDGRGFSASSGLKCLKCRGRGVVPAPTSRP
jgi:DnaJ-class molecular chaperone